jgi:hypothetical protein
MIDHTALRARVVQHIESDSADHAELLVALDTHIAEADETDQDHAALRALLIAHVERTDAGHGRLLKAIDRHAAAVDG